MDSTKPTSLTPEVPSWKGLPREIREQILGYLGSWKLEENEVDDEISYPVLASVCQEWQEYFEGITFQSIKLNQHRLEYFGSIVSSSPRRIEALRHVHLQIQLPSYDCYQAATLETRPEVSLHDMSFTMATVALFNIMAPWPAVNGKQTTLELSAFSPSDTQHGFKKLSCHENNTLFQFRPRPKSDFEFDDLHHILEDSGIVRLQRMQGRFQWKEVARVGGIGLRMLHGTPKLPDVGKINAFTIRRQCNRNFDAENGLNNIIEALPNLTELTYEPWMGFSQGECCFRDTMERELMHCISTREHIKTVRIFKSFHPQTSHCYDRESDNMPYMRLCLGPFFAGKSRHLHELSLCYITDAVPFFAGFKPAPSQRWAPYDELRWNHLKSLVLTADSLREDGCPGVVLQLAAKGVKHMPKLEFMAIWNSSIGHGAVVRYVRAPSNDAPPKLSIQSTWHLQLSFETLELWEEVAESHGSRYPLEVAYRDLAAERFKCYTSMLHYRSDMSLVPGVATSTTMKEMEYNDKVMEWHY